jgi:acyl-CoA synthetase (AMP-forming)/AMP-acid ligase II
MYITQGLHRSLQANPLGIATVEDGRERTFTEFADRIARFAAALHAAGARPGDRIGIVAENSVRWIEYALACPWGGLVVSPLNYRWSLAEMTYQVRDCQIAILLADEQYLGRARELRRECPEITALVYCGQGGAPGDCVAMEALIAGARPMADVRIAADTLAGILYTGGTTGEPKGVMISSGQLMVSSIGTLASAGMANVAERFLHISPFFHLAALASLYQNVLLGSTHFVVPQFDPENVATAIEKHRITNTTMIPTTIHRLFRYADAAGRDLSSLRRLGYGAEPISPAVLQHALAMLPELQMCQRYGMTELGPVATVLRPEDHRDPEHPELLSSAGRAALHVELRVVDSAGDDRPPGEVGEIIVRGGNLMLGYWNKPEETARALRGGWMHTGDLGRLDDNGYLYVVDRLKDMIVTGGENVYSAEVEKVLAAHPAVDACAVIGVPDPEWGERVHAVVVPVAGRQPDPAELRAFVGDRIARYKSPRSFEFVAEMPRSTVGKILKWELRDRHARSAAAPRGT